MAGIERIKIQSSWDDLYIKKNKDGEPTANALYPEMFAGMGMPLADNEVIDVKCTKEEAKSRYDWQEGIDVILHFAGGDKATMQEKFLDFRENNLTVETVKTNGAPGAWFYCTAQYYFVSYFKDYANGDYSFRDWILVDWPALHRADARDEIDWIQAQNNHLGRRAIFHYVHFDLVPGYCVLARRNGHQPKLF